MPNRQLIRTAVAATVLALPVPALAAPDADEPQLLTQPVLGDPEGRTMSVAWFTEQGGTSHAVLTGEVDNLSETQVRQLLAGQKVKGRQGRLKVQVHSASTTQLSRTAEDATSLLPAGERPAAQDGIVARQIFRHEARVGGLHPVRENTYRVVSVLDGQIVLSDVYSMEAAPRRNEGVTVLLTSDHQAKNNTPANIQLALETLGDIDAIFQAGDLVNIPDRASEWFDSTNNLAYFPVMQGQVEAPHWNGRTYTGAPLLQTAPLYSVIGNHEVQGRRDGATSLNASFGNPVPVEVAEAEYAKVADRVNPTGDPAVKARWIEDNSFSTTTYEEMLTLPESETGGERYYATSVGNVRLISLYSTRIWHGNWGVQPDPALRTTINRYHESREVLDEPLRQGHGMFPFESLAVDSEQYDWLRQELASKATRQAEHVVVMMHEGPQGLGDNVVPHFTDPVRVEERDDQGNLVGIRYDYPAEGNMLLTDLTPLIDTAGTPVDLVFSGHSHLWNRFESAHGVDYLESSNVGNTYGAFHELSGRTRPQPPAPWDAEDYPAQGNPGGLEPVVPNVAPFTTADGTPLPFVQSNGVTVFSALDSTAGTVTSWAYDLGQPDRAPWIIDSFSLDD